jgi:hypothetical protein
LLLYSDENFSSVSETAPGSGGKNPVKLDNRDCSSVFICENWRECEVEYDLHKLIKGNFSAGIQHRHCKDYAECMSDFVDSRECKIKNDIFIEKVNLNGREYLEIYDVNKRLIGKIDKVEVESLDKLVIEFVI